MAKKTAAQLKRLTKRAEARGEVYVPVPLEEGAGETNESDEKGAEKEESSQSHQITTTNDDQTQTQTSVSKQDTVRAAASAINHSKEDKTKLKVAIQLDKELKEIELNADLKAKERRSAKRKAEAIAVELSGCSSVEELLEWYETTGKHQQQQQQQNTAQNTTAKKSKGDAGSEEKKRSNPYIVFIGQLAFDTTKEELFQHIKTQLEEDHKVTEHNIKIRLLQDANTKKSRGMAFVEVKDDPELLYSCLKLHHTHLGGRRINVERSAGGGSDTKKTKIKQFREEQEQHMDAAVNSMLQEYYKRGEIQEQGEIDEGVIKLCKRHSATVVQAALERYVESNGRDMDNPSAYLTFLIGKLAEEGIYNDRDKDKNDRGNGNSSSRSSIQNKQRPSAGKDHGKSPRTNASKRPAAGKEHTTSQPNKRPKQAKSAFSDSEFAKQGVDMRASEGSADLLKIFPSLSRGRGRGRGYM